MVRSLKALPQPQPEAVQRPGDAVYTSPWTVELILDLAGYVAESNLVDSVAIEPSAGDGAFLVHMAERLVASCRRHGRPLTDCAGSLAAYELDAPSADLARRAVRSRLTQIGVSLVDASALARRWVRRGDYLLDSARRVRLTGDAAGGTGGGADFVIGNPPYIRLEDIPPDKNTLYREIYPTMKGRADVYVAFFEAALRQLNQGGVCAFICADRWMRNQYGEELRHLVTSKFGVEAVVEMHDVEAFEASVIAYPAITVIRRGPQRQAVVARAAASVIGTRAREVAAALLRCGSEGDAAGLPEGVRAYRAETWFAGKAPWPCTSPERLALLKRLERDFLPLESEETGTKVGIGVATGLDEIYITRDPSLVEKERLLPLALTGDTVTGRLAWSGHYLVNPWSDAGLVELDRFPRLKSYYERAVKLIKKRNVSQRDPSNWYRTIDRVNFRLMGRPKLYIPDIKGTIHPVLDGGATYPHHNLYFVTSNRWDLEVLGAILMSDVGRFFVECYGVRMRGGFLRMQAQYLRRIRVPAPDTLTLRQSEALGRAFRDRDTAAATAAALEVYEITHIPADV